MVRTSCRNHGHGLCCPGTICKTHPRKRLTRWSYQGTDEIDYDNYDSEFDGQMSN
ncbi:hypothetical protein [uncultured Methanobrevibacter sp.]|uniref:hypothetical protein n=1 Tax=uncultured Methanobrevibacter sp. TaxID=253161 RepID=UPI0025FBDCE1|nr:hypothetical protein [uncultured Methanobrevibacter sp.]